jgi:hypothetical protein
VFENLNSNGRASGKLNKRNRSNLIVGYFALGGGFNSLVGIGLYNWWAEGNATITA